MKIGIVFAGQGAQYSGMGKDLYDNYPEAKEIFDMAGDRSRMVLQRRRRDTETDTRDTADHIHHHHGRI